MNVHQYRRHEIWQKLDLGLRFTIYSYIKFIWDYVLPLGVSYEKSPIRYFGWRRSTVIPTTIKVYKRSPRRAVWSVRDEPNGVVTIKLHHHTRIILFGSCSIARLNIQILYKPLYCIYSKLPIIHGVKQCGYRC